MNLTVHLISIVLLTLTGVSLAYMLSLPPEYGLGAGLVIGILLAAMQNLSKKQPTYFIEMTSLVLLVIISAIISWQALVPLLSGSSVQTEKSLPLLITTAALYTLYMLSSQTNIMQRQGSVTSKLAVFFSGPPPSLTFIMSITIATYALLSLHYLQLHHPSWGWIADKFLDRGIIPPLTVFLFCWGLLMIVNKTYILWHERALVNDGEVSQKSLLIQTYYQNLKDTGATSPDHYLDLLWKKSADFYIIPRYINWAIPILGFIGTVLGISLAADGIQNIINTQQSFGQLSSELGKAISPLGIAFDTTLIALSLSVLLMLLQTALQRWEDNLLIDYENHIRNMPLNTL